MNVEDTEIKQVSTLRRALPQFIAVGVKNLVLFGRHAITNCPFGRHDWTKICIFFLYFDSGYGMTLGFPTIVIPAIKGGDGRTTDQQFSLTDEQISWFSMCAQRVLLFE